jgi:dihydrolipoamide dehydrogenase
MHLKKRGVAVEASARVSGIEGELGALCVSYVDRRGNEKQVEAEGVLVACGRRANTEGLFGPDITPELVRGALVCDADGRTSVEHLWAIGDVVAGNIQLAHVAEAQARNVAAAICGDEPPVDLAIVPSCVYTSPEVASVGLAESEAKAQGIKVRVGKSLTGANGKCLVEGSESGYVKLVVSAETGAILGAQLVCPRATDLVAELALAISLGCTARQLAAVIHPHPTVSELISSAARALAK